MRRLAQGRLWWIAAALSLFLMGPTQAMKEVFLYDGKPQASPLKPVIGAWGSGEVEEVSEFGIGAGNGSLKVKVDGYYVGLRIDFQNQPDLSEFLQEPNAFFSIDAGFLRRQRETTVGGMGGLPSMGGIPGLPGRGRMGEESGAEGSASGYPGSMGIPGMPGMGSAMSPMMGAMPPYAGGIMPGLQGGAVSPSGSAPLAGFGGGPGTGQGNQGEDVLGRGFGGQGGLPGMPGMPGMAGMPGAAGSMSPYGGAQGGISPYGSSIPGGISPYGSSIPGGISPYGSSIPGGPDSMMAMMGQMMGGGATSPYGGAMAAAPGTGPGLDQLLSPATGFLRIILQTTDGALAIEDVAVPPETERWNTIVLPLDRFKRLGALQNARLKRIILSGDAKDEFYIARIRLVADNEPFTIEAVGGRERTIQAGTPIEFRVNADVGLSIVKYRWSFGDGSPVQETDEPKAIHTYGTSGDYSLTVEVVDTEGKKQPASTTITVHVIP